ncbi:MAG: AAA family ATPase [Lachnospiraceae bacterium]|nr:AAA family ATPase [Lachnospiraceae bacterium]MDE6941093.1 AAA family ATPase [Lachnospiraceae bacterium]
MQQEILSAIRSDGFSFRRLSDRCPGLRALKTVPQDPSYHGEGDVYAHTEMVCERLLELDAWSSLPRDEQALLFLAAAYHDIGKISCTRQGDKRWISPKHTMVGEKVFRRTVYREADQFCLTFDQRETAAKLIRYHGLPVWFWTKARPEYDLFKAAESIPLRLLYLLSKADVQGRITSDPKELEDQAELFADYAKELGIWEKPYAFADPYTKYQYFHRENLWHKAALYDDTEFDVIVMSGLPLAGKDSWIECHGKGLPVVSLDEIRRQHRIPPAKDTGKIVQIALAQAKTFLRQKKPFIWNATNIIQETRQRLVSLFAGYGARVHIVYLEAPYQELLDRNRKRARYIPEPVLEDMIRKLELPAPWEGFSVKNSLPFHTRL